MTPKKMLLRLAHAGLLAAALGTVLSGCATTEVAVPAPVPTMASLVQQADTAVKAGRYDEAVTVLKNATRIYPADKVAWLRMAQVNFECQEYGDAITHAKKVLDRDPDDTVAHSILAVSGLRVSSRALADLAAKKNISGDVRDAAQDLAKILRISIGGDIMPTPKEGKGSAHGVRNLPRNPTASAVKNTGVSLLDILNGANEAGKK